MLNSIKNLITPPRIIVAGLVALYFILANIIFGHVSPTMILFGLPCPGCGLTRSGLLFLTGNFLESFLMHPLLVPIMAFIACAAVYKLYLPHKFNHIKNLAIALTITMIVVYIFRMVLLFPDYPPLVVNHRSIFHRLIGISQTYV